MTGEQETSSGVHRHGKAVIVLGAGASAADGAPVQSELFRGYFQSPTLSDRVDPQMQEDLKKYFTQLWGIDVNSNNLGDTRFPTFEEALGLLEIARDRGELFKDLAGCDQGLLDIERLRNHLTSVIALILEEKLHKSNTNHIRLIKHLDSDGSLSSTVFISSNYDILIDNAIEFVTNSLPDYGVLFEPEPTKSVGEVLLFKIHGSLNWLYCPTCSILSLFPHHKAAAELPNAPYKFRCRQCRGLRDSVVIPPTFFKVMSNLYLQQIWKKAEETLKEAQRIIFCGYSFPDADMHIKYLLKRAEVNRMGEVPEVFIVNEHRGKKKEEREMERDRYMRFFRKKDKVHWTKLSFNDFAENPVSIEDKSKWL